jgi:hypothetical protein
MARKYAGNVLRVKAQGSSILPPTAPRSESICHTYWLSMIGELADYLTNSHGKQQGYVSQLVEDSGLDPVQ